MTTQTAGRASGGRVPPSPPDPHQRGSAALVHFQPKPRIPLAPHPHLRETRAVIYRQTPSVTQSGRAGAKNWILEFEPTSPPVTDSLMGWTGGGGERVRLRFPDRASAERFARRQGVEWTVVEPPPKLNLRPKSYADNFRVAPLDPFVPSSS
ncbi:MAG TPA: NADH dehydrogenase ubiquinone Fe-S protein 4 [Alphaproteobacteria bacterium]